MAEEGLPAPKIHSTPKAVRAKMDQTTAADQADKRPFSEKASKAKHSKTDPSKAGSSIRTTSGDSTSGSSTKSSPS